MSRTGLSAIALLVLTSAAGCGGADEAAKGASQPPAVAPSSVSADDLATPEGAYAALGRAEGEIAVALGPSPVGGMPAAAPPPAPEPAPAAAAAEAPPSPPPPPPPAKAAAPAAPPPAHAADRDLDERHKNVMPAESGAPCGSACAALASMERAADHLCSLAGPADARCGEARDRVKRATARVRAACPACAG